MPLCAGCGGGGLPVKVGAKVVLPNVFGQMATIADPPAAVDEVGTFWAKAPVTRNC